MFAAFLGLGQCQSFSTNSGYPSRITFHYDYPSSVHSVCGRKQAPTFRFIGRLYQSSNSGGNEGQPQRNSNNPSPQQKFLEKRQKSPVEGFLETAVPPIVPILAFFCYDEVVQAFQETIKLISRNTWLNDGSKEPAILSALNSIVIPTSAILYATLTATTINALRQRQQSIREALNKEASELRILQNLLPYFPETRQDRFRLYLVQYTTRVISECQPILNLRQLESKGLESEITDMLREINAMVAQTSDDDVERTKDVLIFQAYDALVRLKNTRAERLSALQNRLPILHYLVLASLAVSITVGFLIETNKAKVDFDAFQLRILWTQLVASSSALGVVCYDLNAPFGGNYQVRLCGATGILASCFGLF